MAEPAAVVDPTPQPVSQPASQPTPLMPTPDPAGTQPGSVPGPTGTQPTQPGQPAPAAAPAVAPAAEGPPEWMTDKRFLSDDGKQVDTEKLFKSWEWASSKLGSFTGVPEINSETGQPGYELVMPEGLTGGEDLLSTDDPMWQKAVELAASQNMSQDGLKAWVDMFLTESAADNMRAHDAELTDLKAAGYDEAKMAKMGDFFFNLVGRDPGTFEKIQSMINSVDAVRAFETLQNAISKSTMDPMVETSAAAGTITEASWKSRYDNPLQRGSSKEAHEFQAETLRQGKVLYDQK